jgi:aminoglycoside 6'-N-acetyltransferase I
MTVRAMREAEVAEVAEVHAMMTALWPDFDGNFGGERVMVWDRGDGGGLGGFVAYGVRAYGEGCDTAPVPWIEGWWVAPDLRRTGVGRALIAAVEAWAREAGYAELGSDALLENEVSLTAHAAIGFEPTERLQYFRKRLR